MNESSKDEHDCYHLISGTDLPIKTHSYLLDFFEKNYGEEFIGVIPKWTSKETVSSRFKRIYFFQEKIGKKKNLLFCLSRCIVKIQDLIKYERYSKERISFLVGQHGLVLPRMR